MIVKSSPKLDMRDNLILQEPKRLTQRSSAGKMREELKPKIVNIDLEGAEKGLELKTASAERWGRVYTPTRGGGDGGGYTFTQQRLSLTQLKIINREKKRNEKPRGEIHIYSYIESIQRFYMYKSILSKRPKNEYRLF
jgi:hypothetical protein